MKHLRPDSARLPFPAGRRPDASHLERPSAIAVAVLLLGTLVAVFGPTPPAVAAEGGITGFFATAQSSDAANRAELTAMQQAGADTVITFGYTLTQVDADTARSGRFADCQVDGLACYDHIRSGITVRKVLEYKGNTEFTNDQQLCARDVFTSGGGYSYGVLAVPVDGSCADAASFDIVLTAHTGVDKAASMTTEAGKLGMEHFIGMPAPDKRTDKPWLPDTSYLVTLKDFTGRFADATGNPAGLGGFYQHREMPMSGKSVWDGMLTVYGMQNAAIAAKSATKAVLISPYVDARRSMEQPPSEAKAAAGRLGDTKGGLSKLIIAPQDGMGTGKGTAYDGDKWHWRVDPFQRTIVGDVTNAEAYFASSAGYFAAIQDGIAGRSGVTLWGNLEAMAPIIPSGDNANPCSTGHSDSRGFTWDSRMTAQLQQVSGITAKNISYHWDYYLCGRNGGPPLKDVIASLG